MKNSPKAIFFDIDGTLITGGRGPFADDLETMNETSAKGNFLFVNTGRSFANIPDSIMKLPLWNGIVAGGGAHILMKEESGGTAYKTIYRKWVDEKYLAEVCAWYLEMKKQLILEGENNCYVICPSSRKFCEHPVKIINCAEEISGYCKNDFITKLTMADISGAEERNLLEKIFRINVFPTYAEAIIAGENKARGMAVVLEAIGLKREDSIAIGDSVNDLDMIRWAGLGVAMGNAEDEVKAAAGEITASCGEGGIADMLRKYVLNSV